MKKILHIAAAMVGCAFLASAVLPTYKTLSAVGGATGGTVTNAGVCFPADPNSQIRLVNVLYKSDTNPGSLYFSTGVGAYYIAFTNAATAVTNFVNSTNGLSNGSIIVLQQGGNCYTSSISSYGNSGTGAEGGITNQSSSSQYGPAGAIATNVCWIVTPAALAATPQLYADVFQMSAATLFTVGATTNNLAGDAIYVGNYGRPVLVLLGPPGLTNAISAATAHYDSQSN